MTANPTRPSGRIWEAAPPAVPAVAELRVEEHPAGVVGRPAAAVVRGAVVAVEAAAVVVARRLSPGLKKGLSSGATLLYQIQQEVHARVQAIEVGAIESAYPAWPCRKGCDECCRSLANPPRVSRLEWARISAAIDALPAEVAVAVRQRIRNSAHASRPVVCPLLDSDCGTCLIYEARPIACRAYGFYAEREEVLGCHRIELLSRQSPDVVWGNHAALEDRLVQLGPGAELSTWLGSLL